MYKQQYRLTKKNDFDNVHKNGRSSFDSLIGVKVVANNLEYSRFGIIVSKKISKLAVKRNLIKRRIRAALKLKLKEIKPGYDCVIMAQAPIIKAKYALIEESLNKHFIKLRLF